METIAGKLREVLDKHGPGAIGCYNSGQLFLEEYDALSTVARLGIETNHHLPVGGCGLLRDLHDVCWAAVTKAGEALRDEQLAATGKRELVRTERQARWLRTLLETTAAQALTVDGDVSSEVRAALPAVAKRYLAAAAIVAPLVATLGVGLVRRLRA